MTEQISGILHLIRGKFHELHASLEVERARNASAESEVRRLRSLVSAGEEKLQLQETVCRQQEEEINALQSSLVQLNEQISNQTSELTVNKDAAIDELVREIEHCISQLKQ
jgi:chromosome segregation ATPase